MATPDLASLRNAKNIIELVRHARPNDAPPRLVINQAGICPSGRKFPPRISPKPWAWSPPPFCRSTPPLFGQAANNGQMVIELAPKAPVSEACAVSPAPSPAAKRRRAGEKSPTSILSFLKSRKQA